MTSQSLHNAYNEAAKVTKTLPLGQTEFCESCHSGTMMHARNGLQVIHNQGCQMEAARKEESSMATATQEVSTSSTKVKAALPATLTQLVTKTKLSATTIRKALKDLNATQDASGTWTAPGVKKAAPAKKTPAKKAAHSSGEGIARSREEAQRRDAHVLVTLKKHKNGLTREQLRDASGAGDLTYMSLWRLHKAKQVRKIVGGSRQPVWQAV